MGKNCIFEDNIRVWVLKMFLLGKKRNQLFLGIFQIRLHGEEIYWAKTAFLKITRVLILKTFVLKKKDPILSWNFSNLTTWRGDMGQYCIFEDNTGVVCTQNICLKNEPHLSWNLLKDFFILFPPNLPTNHFLGKYPLLNGV